MKEQYRQDVVRQLLLGDLPAAQTRDRLDAPVPCRTNKARFELLVRVSNEAAHRVGITRVEDRGALRERVDEPHEGVEFVERRRVVLDTGATRREDHGEHL